MSTHELKRRRGTTEELKYFRGAVGELTVDTDKNTVVVHDGSTYGGHPLVTQRDLFEFLGKDYFINVEDLSDNLRKKLDETIDIDYIDSVYRRLDIKITEDDIEDNMAENIRKVISIEEEFRVFLESIKSSELSYADKKFGADLVGFCITNNRFSKNVLTVQDAIDELVVRLYNEEYNTTKLNKIMTEFSSKIEAFRQKIYTYDDKFLTYSRELELFKENEFNPIKNDIETNNMRIDNLEINVYNKSQVDAKIAETFNSTSSIWDTVVKLNEFFQGETSVENVIVGFYAQLSDEITILEGKINELEKEIRTIKNNTEKITPIYGSGTFNSLDGYVINHYLNTLNYTVTITPTSDPDGKLGEIWVIKSQKYCTVYCSGSTRLTTFDFLITESDRFQ